VTNGAILSTDTSGQGNAGSLTVLARDTVSVKGAKSSLVSAVAPEGIGNGNEIKIVARSLKVQKGAQLNAGTFGRGHAGDIDIDVREEVILSGFEQTDLNGEKFNSTNAIETLVGFGSTGNGGNIRLKSQSLSLNDGSTLTSRTLGRGNAGNIAVQVDDLVVLDQSVIGSGVASGGVGNGGNIEVQTRSIALTNGGQVTASVSRGRFGLPSGRGKGGSISIDASESVRIAGTSPGTVPATNPFNSAEVLSTVGFSSGLVVSTERGALGPAGSITVNTDSFRLAAGGTVEAITENASEAGDITINARTFEAVAGGQVLTTTFSSGRAGDIVLNVADGIEIAGSDPTFANRLAQSGRDVVSNQGAGSGVFANTTSGSTGRGGSITINTQTASIHEGAGIGVNSQGTGIGGGIAVRARNLTLDTNAFISAETASTQGGDIRLQIDDLLLLRRRSRISTTAGTAQAGGNGGNITIDAGFIVAPPSENSDITANAFTGNGGMIEITAKGIFGIFPRSRLTALSDITASSQFGVDGTVQLNTLGIDPSRGLGLLPNEPTTLQVAASCQTRGGRAAVEFFDVGSGGLPPRPDEPLHSATIIADLIPLEMEIGNESTLMSETTVAHQRVEAMDPWGWGLLSCRN